MASESGPKSGFEWLIDPPSPVPEKKFKLEADASANFLQLVCGVCKRTAGASDLLGTCGECRAKAGGAEQPERGDPEINEWAGEADCCFQRRRARAAGPSVPAGTPVKARPFPPIEDDLQLSPFERDVEGVLGEVSDLLIRKNAAYGNSAMEPLRVFSKADADEAIRVRIDDKLSRLRNGTKDDEDTVLDLMGYLVLLRIARRKRTTA